MARLFMEVEGDIRKLAKICHVCNKPITEKQAFSMKMVEPIKFTHLDCEDAGKKAFEHGPVAL